jgi:hypothetical protein
MGPVSDKAVLPARWIPPNRAPTPSFLFKRQLENGESPWKAGSKHCENYEMG